MFAFSFKKRIKTIAPVISCWIDEALLITNHF